MKGGQKAGLGPFRGTFVEVLGVGVPAAAALLGLAATAGAAAVFWVFHSAPPESLTFTGGPPGSAFSRHASKYGEILQRNGVALRILPSDGSPENLDRLSDKAAAVDAGFVEGGEAQGREVAGLVSLGTLYHQPLLVFHRGSRPVERLSQLEGGRLAIGPPDTGTRDLALALLEANGIEPGGMTRFEDLAPVDAAKALLAGKVDAVFLMGDSAPAETVRALLGAPGIRLCEFPQTDAYVRLLPYLTKLTLPKGSIDIGKDIPPHDVPLIGPAVELVARKDLNPALADLLMAAAKEVHGGPGLFRRQGEFPSPQEREYPLSPYAARFYASGKSFFYRSLPFWLASLVDRVLLVSVPLIVVLIPALKVIPAAYRWRINLGIYRWYRELLVLEQDVLSRLKPEDRPELLSRLDRIEAEVNKMKVPAPFAGQFYELRGHINFVRTQLTPLPGPGAR